jgi:hypothetical protein
MSYTDYLSLEATVRAMNARRAQQSLNESASRGRRTRKIDAFKSHRLEDVAIATLLRNQQERINEAEEEAELQNGPEARYDARQDAVNRVRDMYKDMRANVKPSERGFCLADDGWSGTETARFVAALQEAAELYGVTENHILNMCAVYDFLDEVSEGRTDPYLTREETEDLCHKIAEMTNVSFRQAYEYLVEWSKAALARENGENLAEDVWNDPEFCRQFVELHETHEGYYWIDGKLHFISDQRGVNEQCGAEETAAFIENERRMRLASVLGEGTGFSR